MVDKTSINHYSKGCFSASSSLWKALLAVCLCVHVLWFHVLSNLLLLLQRLPCTLLMLTSTFVLAARDLSRYTCTCCMRIILWTWLVWWVIRMYYKRYDAKSAQMSGVHLFLATYLLWSMSLALPRHCHNYFQFLFMIKNGKWFSNAECICVVCVEVLRPSQQLR